MQDNDNGLKKPNSNDSDAPTNVTTAVFEALDSLNAADSEVTAGELVDHVLTETVYGLSDVTDELNRLVVKGEVYQPTATTVRRVAATDGGTEITTPQQVASKLRSVADELERADRQLGTDDIDVDVTDGTATVVAQYDLDDLSKPEMMPPNGGDR